MLIAYVAYDYIEIFFRKSSITRLHGAALTYSKVAVVVVNSKIKIGTTPLSDNDLLERYWRETITSKVLEQEGVI